jgi:hypothetical protein
MSFYHFRYCGGLGPGCYVEDPVANGAWFHVVASVSKPDHRIWWYKNGQLRDSDGFGPADHLCRKVIQAQYVTVTEMGGYGGVI